MSPATSRFSDEADVRRRYRSDLENLVDKLALREKRRDISPPSVGDHAKATADDAEEPHGEFAPESLFTCADCFFWRGWATNAQGGWMRDRGIVTEIE